MSETKTEQIEITADDLFYIVRRLANQMPVRYYLDADGDGSYRTVALDLHYPTDQYTESLEHQLAGYGLLASDWSDVTRRFLVIQTGNYVRRYKCKRAESDIRRTA